MAIDYEAIFGVDNYDPCAALRAMRPAYMRLLAGESEQKITFRDRDLWLYRGDVTQLKALISQLESECAAKSGLPGKRFAITAGSRNA